MGPQGCPLQFNLSERSSPRCPDRKTGCVASGCRRAHFAGDERHNRFPGGRKPREKVAPLRGSVIDRGGVGPLGDRGSPAVVGAPGLGRTSDLRRLSSVFADCGRPKVRDLPS